VYERKNGGAQGEKEEARKERPLPCRAGRRKTVIEGGEVVDNLNRITGRLDVGELEVPTRNQKKKKNGRSKGGSGIVSTKGGGGGREGGKKRRGSAVQLETRAKKRGPLKRKQNAVIEKKKIGVVHQNPDRRAKEENWCRVERSVVENNLISEMRGKGEKKGS